MVGTMNYGALVERVREMDQNHEDFLVPSEQLRYDMDDMINFGGSAYTMNDVAHGHMATKMRVPRSFYNRVGDYPGLRTEMMNRFLETDERTHFVRTMEGTARGILSDRFKPIDNIAILSAAAPVLRDMEIDFKSSSITDKRMYLQVTFPNMNEEITVGDVVHYGLTITNSEVGFGMVTVSPTIWRLVCSNGMIVKAAINHRHIGKQMEIGEDYSVFSDEAIRADREAFNLKLRDTIQAAVNEASFESLVGEMKEAAGIHIANPVKTIKNITKKFSLSDESEEKLTDGLIREGATKWGLINAVTGMAHETKSPDYAYDLEIIGSKILKLSGKEWESIAA